MTKQQIEETIESLEKHAEKIAKKMGLDTATFRYGYFLYLIERVVKSLPSDAQAQFKHRVEELIVVDK